MELKKSFKADLERKRSVFIQIGLVLALGAVFYAFSYNTSAEQVKIMTGVTVVSPEEEMPPVTFREIPKPTLPPMKVLDEFKIVEDITSLDEAEPELISPDDLSNLADIPTVDYVVEDVADNTVFVAPEFMPEFPGGTAAMMAFLARSLKYPSVDIANGVEGTVYLSFVVNRDGSIVDVNVLRGVNASLDREAIRVIESMPKWKPGSQGGVTVRVSYQVPIRFKLQR